jgi:hypothetical protein
MPTDSVIIKVDGQVSVADFRTVVDAFADLMLTLTAETDANAVVDWIVSDLSAGSAVLTSKGTFGNPSGQAVVQKVVGKYEELARSAPAGSFDRFSDRVRQAMQSLTSVVNGKIPRLIMGTPDSPELGKLEQRFEEVIGETTQQGAIGPRPHTRAAVKGQIMTLDRKQGLYFTLQEAYGYQYVRCYPNEEYREKVAEYWAKKTWVIVEGTYARFGDKPTMTRISDIIALPDVEKGGWREAVGAAPRGSKASNISSADAVRKVRDGQT